MPLRSLNKESLTIQPRGIVYLLLAGALMALAYMVIHGNMVMAVGVVALPVVCFVLLVGAQYPLFSYVLYCFFTFYFHFILRYVQIEGFSVVIDMLIVVCVLSIAMNLASKSAKFNESIRNAFNVLSVGQILWLVFILFEALAPYTKMGEFTKFRQIFTVTPICYFLSGIMLDTPKKLRITLVLFSIYAATAALKSYWQKNQGWDEAELRFLLEQDGASTHILRDGTVRYFSIFSDSGTCGGVTGLLFTVLALAAYSARTHWLRWVCLIGAICGGYGLMMSGTRGGMVVPFAGIAVYIFLCKNTKLIVSTVIMGALLYSFFAFTDIGDDNKFIRRARTAFRPKEDASYMVRVENQQLLATFLKDKPFGLGIATKGVVDTNVIQTKKGGRNIPSDSALVYIWIQYGSVGLCVFLIFMGIVILRCCYILLFNVRNNQLRLVLAGLLGSLCGLLVNAYVGRAWEAYPGCVIIPIFFSFVLNGAYIDKQMKPDENL